MDAIVLVAFGTTHSLAWETYENILNVVRGRWPNIPVHFACTGKTALGHAKALGADFMAHSPAATLAMLSDEGFKKVAVQSLHIIPGEEFNNLAQIVRALEGLPKGLQKISLGQPLIAGSHSAIGLAAAFKKQEEARLDAGEAVIYVGHGSPLPLPALVYPAFAWFLQSEHPGLHLTCIEGTPSFAETTRTIRDKGIKRAHLVPLMTVAGDHAVNDMAGDDEDSLKSMLNDMGIETSIHFKGLGHNEAAVNIWLEHLAGLIRMV